MTLILSGTDGLSDVDGSAATPAIRGTDANTGIFFPAADTIAFSEGGVEAMRIDSSGNVGIGTSSPSGILHTYASNGVNYFESPGVSGVSLQFKTNNTNRGRIGVPSGVNALAFWTDAGTTEAMRIDSSGNVGIGTSSPRVVSGYVSVGINGTTGGLLDLFSNGNRVATFGADSGGTAIGSINAAYLGFTTNNTERARITSGGDLLVGATAPELNERLYVRATASTGYAFRFYNTQATAGNTFGQYILYSGSSPNGTSNQFLRCDDSTTGRLEIRSNGGIGNYSANNVNLSDRREKTNFAPAGDYLAKICAIPVQTFNYIDQNLEEDGGLTLGVVAQDVQAVAPEMVMESNWGTEEEPKMRLSIYQTDLQYALMKCIQEQQALITTLTDRITALEAPTGTQA